MRDFRVTFSKTGPLVFISHLDLAHTFVRALNRARIPLRYSEGFSPHPKLVFALPLSVGMAGENEICDIGLREDMDKGEFEARIKAVMPPYIEIKSIEEPTLKLKFVKSADYIVTSPALVADCDKIREILSQDSLITVRKTKSGEKSVDIKAQIISYDAYIKDGDTCLYLTLDATPDGYLNPDYVVKVLRENGVDLGENTSCVRKKIVISQ